MVHQPYEEWLLNDERLTPEQTRDMRVHLRNCPECAALERGNLILRSTPVTAPAAGFPLRFQSRLAAQRKAQWRRSLIGFSLLAGVGMSALLWVLLPYMPYLRLPPGQLASLWISNLVYLALTVRALGALGTTLLNVMGSLVPPYVWAIAMLLLGGTGFLWMFSFQRIGKFLKSAA